MLFPSSTSWNVDFNAKSIHRLSLWTEVREKAKIIFVRIWHVCCFMSANITKQIILVMITMFKSKYYLLARVELSLGMFSTVTWIRMAAVPPVLMEIQQMAATSLKRSPKCKHRQLFCPCSTATQHCLPSFQVRREHQRSVRFKKAHRLLKDPSWRHLSFSLS